MKTYTLCIKLPSRFKTLFTTGCLQMLIYKNRFSKRDYYSIFIQISLAPHVNTLIKTVKNYSSRRKQLLEVFDVYITLKFVLL